VIPKYCKSLEIIAKIVIVCMIWPVSDMVGKREVM
jgi:hypothetical protein